jgi:hypothetical protein
MELLVRFLLGGAIVSAFALLGEIFKPKSFAGLFGAAPSVAIASLALAFRKHDHAYVITEATTMAIGAIALATYALFTMHILRKAELKPWIGAALLWGEWLAVALAGLAFFVKAAR